MTKAKPIMVEVSHRALKGRINRALVRERKQLRTDRRGGDIKHMLIDIKTRSVVATEVDLTTLARRLGVLQPWERATP